MKRSILPPLSILHNLFRYENGTLIVNKTGKAAYTWACRKGYLNLRIGKKNYAVSRVIYYMLTGEQPITVDHINRIRSDNRIENLRGATYKEQAYNRKIACTNTSGYKGVYERNGRFRAQIRDNDGKKISLGTFPTAEEASREYEKAASLYRNPEFHLKTAA